MKNIWILLFALPLFAQVVPDRYVVELSGEPAVTVAARSPRLLRQGAMRTRRAELRAQHAKLRSQVEAQGAEVLGTVDTVANAFLVRIPDADASRLSSIPGVVRVQRVWMAHTLLDQAVVVNRITDAWNALGGSENAGAGIKIGILDTGIDPDHPGFQDPSLTMPAGYPLPAEQRPAGFEGKNKIIVARSYGAFYTTGPADAGPRDTNGHGTAVAMAAAGVRTVAPMATISGVAPKAWLGVYKLSQASSDSFSTDVVLKALDDAVADGMDIVNLSLGLSAPLRFGVDPFVDAIERTAAAGIIVVCAAGNEGPLLNTMSSPATAPSAVAVGANLNSRLFGTDVRVADGPQYTSFPGGSGWPTESYSGPLFDISALDPTGLGCDAFPPGSLTGKVALILRGVCLFEAKANNAQAAGAIAAVIYTDAARPEVQQFSSGAATLPVQFVSYADGSDMKNRLSQNGTLTVSLDPGPVNVPVDPFKLASFSSAGPGPDEHIKPDLVAVGSLFYTAAQKSNPLGSVYDPSGFMMLDGTSFSSPLVAGSFALLKSARPGLTMAQYRSLIINSAAPFLIADKPVAVQRGGAGLLDVGAALRNTATATPTSLSFGVGGDTVSSSRELSITNIGAEPDVLSVSVVPYAAGPAPIADTNTISLASGATQKLSVSFSAIGAKEGEYQGFIVVQGTQSDVAVRVPYWYAVSVGIPSSVRVINNDETGSAGSLVRSAAFFQVTDVSGVGLANVTPTVSVVEGNGSVRQISSDDAEIPGGFSVDVRLGLKPGNNTFRIDAGNASTTFTIVGK